MVLIQVVGIILVITMLTIPAAIANLFTGRLSTMMAVGVGLSAHFSFTGTMAAYHLDWPAGATIGLVAGLAYGLDSNASRELLTQIKKGLWQSPKSSFGKRGIRTLDTLAGMRP